MSIAWGDAPTWIATAGAFVAAYFAYRAFRLEGDRDERALAAGRRAQAAAVAVWPSTTEEPTGELLHFCNVGNASRLPIYDVHVYSYRYDLDGTTKRRGPFEDGDYALGTIAPGDAPHVIVANTRKHSWVYAVWFRDAEGTDWHRHWLGTLSEGDIENPGAFTIKYPYDPTD